MQFRHAIDADLGPDEQLLWVERRKTGLRLAQPVWCRLLEDRRGLRRMSFWLDSATELLPTNQRGHQQIT
ncbi:MAG: hypothetical protein QOI59_5871 [Gammaproteobacteria bacterium]|nr:hypothetical protein [Gammaproteobacteria bacterium]